MNIKKIILNNMWLVFIMILATFLRIYHADFQSIWLDEILSMNDSNPDFTFKEFYDGIMFWEFIPHLYFYILKILFNVFGYYTLVGRLFSAFIGIIGVFSIYLLGKQIYNKKTGLMAASLIAVNVFHIQYSQEIRPYGLLFLFTVLAFYRLIIFIKTPTFKNAILYGLFAGLILNAHFFGFITLFSQYIILLITFIYSQKENRLNFFKYSFCSLIVTLIVFFPVYEPFIRASKINSFWVQKPSIDVYTNLFKEFFGNAEVILYVIQFIVIYYFINLFNQKKIDFKVEKLFLKNKLTFGFLILFFWLIVSLTIPLIKSHIDVPMILSRYLINILPVLILIIAIGIDLIKNKLVKIVIVIVLISFSLIDLVVVKNYYNTISKSQFRELTNDIKKKNSNNSKIVCYWSWLFPYFFQNTSIKIEGNSLENYVKDLKSEKIQKESFWYADANSRPYNLNKEQEDYLNKNFILKERIQFHDAWANYYVSKSENDFKISDQISIESFKPKNTDNEGNILLFENTILTSKLIQLEKGNYEIIINGISLPKEPIKNENAHLRVKINGNEVASIYLNENKYKSENKINFIQDVSQKVRVRIIYDNDIFIDNKDRNVIIYSIDLIKK